MNEQRRPPHPMPEVAAFIANLRAAFGDTVDEAVRRGKAGEPTFFATENGRTVGTRAPTSLSWVVDGSLRDRHYCAGCNGSCIGADVHCRPV
jgi:hypothetical protein